MTDKPNQNNKGDQDKDESLPEPATNSQDKIQGINMPALNGLDLSALLQQQGISSTDLNEMVRKMMTGYPASTNGHSDLEEDDDAEYEDDDDADYEDDEDLDEDSEYDDDDADYEDDEELDDDSEAGTVSSQQDVYQLAQSLMSSPLMSQFSSLMGGPKQTEAERRFNQGKMLQGGGMLEEAASTYLDVIELEPDHFKAHVAMGQVLLTMDRPEDAIPFLQKAEELDPQDPGAPLYLGYAFYALQQYNECVEAFKKAVERDPYNHLALNNLGFSQFLTGDLIEAEKTFIRAGDQGSDRAYYNLGMVRVLQSKPDAGWQAYDEAAELDPVGSQITDHLDDLQKAYALYPDRATLLDQAAERLQARLAEEQYDEDEEYEEDYDDEADE